MWGTWTIWHLGEENPLNDRLICQFCVSALANLVIHLGIDSICLSPVLLVQAVFLSMALTAIGEKWDQLTHSTTNWGSFANTNTNTNTNKDMTKNTTTIAQLNTWLSKIFCRRRLCFSFRAFIAIHHQDWKRLEEIAGPDSGRGPMPWTTRSPFSHVAPPESFWPLLSDLFHNALSVHGTRCRLSFAFWEKLPASVWGDWLDITPEANCIFLN